MAAGYFSLLAFWLGGSGAGGGPPEPDARIGGAVTIGGGSTGESVARMAMGEPGARAGMTEPAARSAKSQPTARPAQAEPSPR